MSVSGNRLNRVHCYLCDLPRTPWSILHDFTEPICRGCCNYEGPDRIEEVIEYARYLRKSWEHQIRNMKSQSLTSSGASAISSPSPGSHSSGNGSAPEANGPLGVGANMALVPGSFHHALHLQHRHFPPRNEEERPLGNSENPGPGELPFPKRFPVPEPGSQMFVMQGNEEPRDPEKRDVMANFQRAKHAEIPPFTLQRRQPEFSDLPPTVRENLEILNSTVPFDVRFKKEPNLFARIFQFEAAPRAGGTVSTDFEMKIYCEYPRGSGTVYQSVSAVAKQMYQDSMKEFARGLSSGFKYLEYEVQGRENEWRLLGDLLPESVRSFKETVSTEMLPVRLTTDQAIPYSIIGNAFFGPGNGPGKARKRKPDETEPPIPPPPPRAPRRTYKEREDEQIQRHLWMQSQVDALRLSMAQLTGPHAAALHGVYRPPLNSAMEHVRPPVPPVATTSPSQHGVPPMPPSPRKPPWGLPSSMAALISAAGSVEPAGTGSGPPGPTGPSTADGNNNQPVSGQSESGRMSKTPKTEKESDKDNGNAEIKNESEGSKSPQTALSSNSKRSGQKGGNHLKCSICADMLEDTHFVQCPSVGGHKFCFPCSKDSIKKQGAGNDVFCPSGKRCPLVGSNLPWAFMQSEIQTILATESKPKEERSRDDENS